MTVTNTSSLKKTKITTIVPSYNYGCYLVEALESVLRQTRPVDEIIISDDFSSDNTPEIGQKYAAEYPGLIKFFRNSRNLGIVANFNQAVNMATGDYICILGADNRLLSNYMEKTSSVLDSDDDLAIAYTDFVLFGPRAHQVWLTFRPEFRSEAKENHFVITFPDFNKQAIKFLFRKGNFIHGSSLYKKTAFLEAGGYKQKSDDPEDYDLFKRMIKLGWSAQRIPLPLLEYRQHSPNQANIRLKERTESARPKRLYQRLLARLKSR